VPNLSPALIHSAVPAADGSIWVAQPAPRSSGRFDPKTEKWEEFEHDWRKHTIVAHPDGSIWSTGGSRALIRRPRPTPRFPEVPTAYASASTRKARSGSAR